MSEEERDWRGKMKRQDTKRLQALIDRTAKHGVRYFEAQTALNEWCRARYGQEPADIDADEIIDALFGGCGMPTGMGAEQFDAIMRGQP